MSRKSVKALAEERRVKVASMLMERLTYRVMADKLGVSIGTIAGDVEALIRLWREEQKPEDRQRWVTQELAKLNRLEARLEKPVEEGDLHAIDRVLKIINKRSELLGLNAPTESIVHAHVNWDDLAKEVASTPVDAVEQRLSSMLANGHANHEANGNGYVGPEEK